jgi:hypothetical protein
MLWHASTQPQRLLPRGQMGTAIYGRPVDAIVSEKLALGRRRA